MKPDVWHLDCFCRAALGGRDFPVNSYFHESLEVVAQVAKDVLASEIGGIDEVRISRKTLGQSLMPPANEGGQHEH